MLALILDFETTGLLPNGRAIELACCVYDTLNKSVLKTLQFLINPNIENTAESINKISKQMIESVDDNILKYEKALFRKLWDSADVIVAHNFTFDKSFVELEKMQGYKNKPWICSMDHITYPEINKGKLGLVDLCNANEIPLVGKPHRAMFDVGMIVSLWNKVEDLNEQIIENLINRDSVCEYVAKMSPKLSFKENNSIFKNNKFRFDDQREKKWYRKMTDKELCELEGEMKVVKVEGSFQTAKELYETLGLEK